MQPARLHADVAPHAIRNRQQRLPLTDRDHCLPRREGQQIMEPPDAAEGQRIAPSHPLSLKHFKRGRDGQAIPVVGDIEQVAAGRATGQDLIDGKSGPAGGIDALLKSEVGSGGNGHGGNLRFRLVAGGDKYAHQLSSARGKPRLKRDGKRSRR